MQLKEFSLISLVIKSAYLFRAIEAAIPLEVIEQTIGYTEAQEDRVSQAAIPTSSVFSDCDEFVVIGFDGNSVEKSS